MLEIRLLNQLQSVSFNYIYYFHSHSQDFNCSQGLYQVLTIIFYLVSSLVPYLSSGFQLILSNSRQIWVTCGHDKSPPANGRLQPNVLCLCIYLIVSTQLWSLKVHAGWNLGKYSRVPSHS